MDVWVILYSCGMEGGFFESVHLTEVSAEIQLLRLRLQGDKAFSYHIEKVPMHDIGSSESFQKN